MAAGARSIGDAQILFFITHADTHALSS